MLNKNQSKKRNSWKYYVVVPVLAAFVLFFQVEVIAKEKQQNAKEVSGETKSVDVYKIKKNSTDADLKEIKEKLKANHDVDFEASEIKRNSDNDLISIKVNVTRGKQVAQSIQTANHAIKDFGVIIITEKDGNKSIGIQTSDEINDSKTAKDSKKATSKKQQTKINTNGNNNSNVSTKTNSNTNTNTSTTVTTNTDSNNSTVTRITTNDGESNIVISNSSKVNYTGKKLVIVDGVEMPSTFSFDDLKSEDIKSMNVFKGEMAADKFGEKGKNGVIVIETRK